MRELQRPVSPCCNWHLEEEILTGDDTQGPYLQHLFWQGKPALCTSGTEAG